MVSLKKTIIYFSIFLLSGVYFYANELPHGYKDVILGMSLEETKDALLKEPDFGYHGERDVSLIPHTNKVLIETDAEKGLGSNFLSRCWFQFHNNQLFTITININTNKMDYYSVFTTLCKKYGEPQNFDPNSATWKNEDVTMSLEKPLTLKYIDNKLFEDTQNYSNVPSSPQELTQEMFLDAL